MKNTYNAPELIITKFVAEDVITASDSGGNAVLPDDEF